MDIRRDKRPVKLNGNTYYIDNIEFGSHLSSNHKKIFFSHGFIVDSICYYDFINSLYESAGKKLTVIAPMIVGHKIKGYDNNSFEANNKIYSAFREDYGHSGDIISHSAGPNDYEETDKIVMINPLVPFEYNVTKFLTNMTFKYPIEDLVAGFLKEIANRSAKAFFKNRVNDISLIKDWKDMGYKEMFSNMPDTDAMVVIAGTNNHGYIRDNLFNYSDFEKYVKPMFKSYQQLLINGNHSDIITRPEPIVEIIKPFLL